MHITVDKVKAAVLSYCRYSMQCPLVALEANCRLQTFNYGGQADVLAVTKNRLLVETEVKLNLADLRRDRNKAKHKAFREGARIYPTARFYFAVPKDIANSVKLICDQLYPYAGVLGVDGLSEQDVILFREAKLLSNRKLSWEELYRMAREQSATICRLARASIGRLPE